MTLYAHCSSYYFMPYFLPIQVQFPAVHGGAELPGHVDEGPGGDRGGVARTDDEHPNLHIARRVLLDLPETLQDVPRHRLQICCGLRTFHLPRSHTDSAGRHVVKGKSLVHIMLTSAANLSWCTDITFLDPILILLVDMLLKVNFSFILCQH